MTFLYSAEHIRGINTAGQRQITSTTLARWLCMGSFGQHNAQAGEVTHWKQLQLLWTPKRDKTNLKQQLNCGEKKKMP